MKNVFLSALYFSAILAGLASCLRAEPLQPILNISPGFAIARVYVVPRDVQGSWVSLCADSRGVLYASDQYGPLYRIHPAAASGSEVVVDSVKLPIGGVHGLTWVGEALYAVVGQREICEPGLYRLRDVDGDREFDSAERLRALAGDGEHGPHAVAASEDGQSLYVIAGNATQLPQLARSCVPERWREDSLLPPLPALIGSETRGLAHGGWICRTDLEGRNWELVCMGLRNAYSLACDASGELFTCDSDTEFEIGMPWYRPNRVLHCISGADFGWRRGALKVPERAPDTLPPLVSMGLGSPTAVLFGRGTAFPARYQHALFVADWSYGRLHAVHLRRSGAGFTAQSEEIVSGITLPITAACVNPRDGALYFTTGGRKTQSALYRLSWRGSDSIATGSRPEVLADALRQRRVLEGFHGHAQDGAVDAAWPHLASQDVVLRHAARVALEFQPVPLWVDRAFAEQEPRTALAALLAVARVGDSTKQPELLDALKRMDWEHLGPLRSEWLRVSTLAFTRLDGAAPEVKQQWMTLLSPRFPTGDRALDAALCELLVFLEEPEIAARAVAQLHSGNTREEQLHFARCLSALRVGWTPELRGDFFDWLGQASSWRGGASFALFLDRIRSDALNATPEDQRGAMELRMAAAVPPASAAGLAPLRGREFVRDWKLAELVALAGDSRTIGSPEKGRKWFVAAGCATCHSIAGAGGAVGMDLTAAARRLSTRDLLETIVDPSKEISDQYGSILLLRRDGSQVQGRIVNHTAGTVHVSENLLDPSAVTKVPESEIEVISRSKVSLMPAGLLNVLKPDEILDLVAYLKSNAGAGQLQAEFGKEAGAIEK